MAFTFVFGTGFEMDHELVTRGQITEGATGIVTTDYHTGVRCHYAKNWYLHVYNGLLESLSQFNLGFWLKRTGVKKLNFILNDGKILYVQPNVDTDLLELYIDGVLTATGHAPVTSGQWINLQFDISIGNSGYFNVRLNGIDDMAFSGDTQPGTSAVLRDVYFEWAAELGKAYYIDDLVFGYGGYPGDRRFDPLYVNGDGSTQEWLVGASTQTAPSAPTLTEGTTTNPQLNGTYYYKISFVDDLGEVMGAVAGPITVVNKRILLSNIPIGNANTTARRIWRTKAGGSDYYLVTTLENNTATTYTDNNNDSVLGDAPPDAAHPQDPTDAHYLNVWDVPSIDNTFLYTEDDAKDELFTLTDWDGTNKEALGVVVWCKGNKNTADTQQVKFLMKSGSTLDVGDAKHVDVPLSYVYDHYLIDPDTSAAWTEAGINAIEVGLRSVIP